MNRKKELIFFYSGFPKNWANIELNQVDLVKIEQRLKFKDNVLIVNKDIEKIVVFLLENNEGEVFGYDFSELQSDILKNDLTIQDLNFKKYTVIYNIGTELANNKTYSGQILKALRARAKKLNKNLILSGVNSSELEKTYGFKI